MHNTHLFTSAWLPIVHAYYVCMPAQQTRSFKNVQSRVGRMSRRFAINTAGRCMRCRQATQLLVK